MKEMRRLIVMIPAVALVVLIVALVMTEGSMDQAASILRGNGAQELVDQQPYETAHRLAAVVVSAEEQGYAQEAERIADHEVDQAFATALRQAGMQQRVLTGAAAGLAKRIEDLKGMVKDDQAKVDGLTTLAKTAGTEAAAGDEVDVAKAQLQLDEDEITDAADDLARESGDRRGEIQQELTAREAVLKKTEGGITDVAVVVADRYSTFYERASAYVEQSKRARLVAKAAQAAREAAHTLRRQHAELESRVGAAAPGMAASGLGGSAKVSALNAMAGRRVVMSILDDRVQSEEQLAAIYDKWEQQVWLQQRVVRHLLLESLAWVFAILLTAALGATLGPMVLARVSIDARRARTLETIWMLGVEVLGLIGVLLVVFGLPSHTPTILGLATAGLTVVFQDFILAFFGWFVLMGKNGIRVSDWVEIDGVGGEVTEIGLFRTSLLETGNWTSSGHPTGRRVTFINSFAIRGRYFNFSTHGQWMWDEIKLNVPANVNAYEVVKKMQEAVEAQTVQNSEEAEREWQSSSRQNGLTRFSAKPTVELRPTVGAGVDVIVRFVTRARERFELRNKIFDAVLGLMEGTERPTELKAP